MQDCIQEIVYTIVLCQTNVQLKKKNKNNINDFPFLFICFQQHQHAKNFIFAQNVIIEWVFFFSFRILSILFFSVFFLFVIVKQIMKPFFYFFNAFCINTKTIRNNNIAFVFVYHHLSSFWFCYFTCENRIKKKIAFGWMNK